MLRYPYGISKVHYFEFYCKKFDFNTTGYFEIVTQLYQLQITVSNNADELIVHNLSQLETTPYFIPDWANNFPNKPVMQCWGVKMKKDILI